MAQRDDVAELVGLVDRLENLLDRSGLSELEVEVGNTTLILRGPTALAPTGTPSGVSDLAEPIDEPAKPSADDAVLRSTHQISAPLTGVFYLSPSPDAEPYVREGGQVNAGQVIGLIEAMKLFNEIKSDVTGTVRAITVCDGDLVKAKQPLIEVDPS